MPVNLVENDNPYNHFKWRMYTFFYICLFMHVFLYTFFYTGCIMSNFSAMIGYLNRESIGCAESWKRRNPDLVGIEDKMPDFVKDIPSIDLKDAAYKQVLINIDFLQTKSRRLRGDTTPRYFIFIYIILTQFRNEMTFLPMITIL